MMEWRFEPDSGRLTVSGNGPMPAYEGTRPAPWAEYREQIREVVIEEGITEVADFGFRQCVNLETVSVPSSAEILGCYCFAECESLKEVKLPEGVRVIGFRAFSKCSSLARVYIPCSVAAIEKKTFGFCPALKEVIYAGTEEQWNRIRIGMMTEESTSFVQIPRRYEGEGTPDRPEEPIDALWFREREETVPVLDEVREILSRGGDGRLHWVVPEMNVPEGREFKTCDFALVIFPDGQTMMIDAGIGHAKEKAMDAVKRMGLKRLDYLLITHLHRDHVQNGIPIAEYLYEQGGTIGTLYSTRIRKGKLYPQLAEYLEEKGVNMQECVTKGDMWEIGGVTIQVLWPSEEQLGKAKEPFEKCANLISIATKFTFGKSSLMTAGDLYREQERYLVSELGEELKSDVMKLNHHGNYTSNSREWIQTVDPGLVVCPTMCFDVGDTVLMEQVLREGKTYWTPGLNGDLLISMDRDGKIEAKSSFGEIWNQE